jgi:hypothetical protein
MLYRSYHFAVHDNGTKPEELGDMELRGDVAALVDRQRRWVLHRLDHGRYGRHTRRG